MNRLWVLLPLLCAAAGCAGEPTPPGVIDRETFIATYVDLRRSIIGSPDFEITEAQRSDVLSRHGVDAESLMRFADVHGPDLEYMSEVWTEIDERLKAADDESASPR